MFNKEISSKIDTFLKDNLDIIFKMNFDGVLLLNGGALKGFIMDIPIKDYDLILLTQSNVDVEEFLKKNKLKYWMKKEHGYTFFYNDFKLGIKCVNDLSDVGILSTDMLFYDIYRKQFIPIGIKQSIQKRKVIDYGYFGYPKAEQRKRLKRRTDVAKKFIQFMNNDNKKVKVIRKNNYYRRMFFGFLKHPDKIKKIFVR